MGSEAGFPGFPGGAAAAPFGPSPYLSTPLLGAVQPSTTHAPSTASSELQQLQLQHQQQQQQMLPFAANGQQQGAAWPDFGSGASETGASLSVVDLAPLTLCASSALMQPPTVMDRGKGASYLMRVAPNLSCMATLPWTAVCGHRRIHCTTSRWHGAGYAGPAAALYQSTQTAQPAYAAFQPSQQQQQQTQPSTQQPPQQQAEQQGQQQGQPQPLQQQLYSSPDILAAAATHQAGLYALQGRPPGRLARVCTCVTCALRVCRRCSQSPCKCTTSR